MLSRTKIKDFYYKSSDGLFAVKINYNNLCYDHYSLNKIEHRLLGAVDDRIEAYFIRKNYTKITIKEFDTLISQFNIN